MMYVTFTMALFVPLAFCQEPAQSQPKTDPAAVKLFTEARAARAAANSARSMLLQINRGQLPAAVHAELDRLH